MIRKLLIRFLLKILIRDYEFEGIQDKRIYVWLASLYTNSGFRDYFRKRDLQLLKTIGSGVNSTAYTLYLGQRLELMHLLSEIDKAYKIQNQLNALAQAKKNLNQSDKEKQQ